MNTVTEVHAIKPYVLFVRFSDGVQSEIDVSAFFSKGFAREMLDYEKFCTVRIEEGGGVAWSNGYDVCPNYLKEIALRKALI